MRVDLLIKFDGQLLIELKRLRSSTQLNEQIA